MSTKGKFLAVQMYTIREFTKTGADLAASLKKIAAMGYPAVQMSAVGCMGGETPEVSAAEAKKMLDDNGLICIATHRAWPALLNETDKEIEFHHALGCDFTAIGGLPVSPHTPHTYREWLKEAAPVVAKLKAAGIRFGVHNHSHEFIRDTSDPRLNPMNVWIDEGGPDLMLELDLYWIDHAGLNCERILERSHGRVPVIHLKDKEVIPGDGPVMAPIGEGNMDWPHIIPACQRAGVRWYAVEQDTCRRDPFDCLKSSFDFLAGMGL
ncbi:MAG: sugar phosphate isomerase/epimerase [Lentisphaerae bacterium]|nr:sugar phosphate isomerase/epimerase [Lentisphaerota bacterium]